MTEEVLLGRDVFHKIVGSEKGSPVIECGNHTLIQKIRVQPRFKAEVFKRPCQVCYKDQ